MLLLLLCFNAVMFIGKLIFFFCQVEFIPCTRKFLIVVLKVNQVHSRFSFVRQE